MTPPQNGGLELREWPVFAYLADAQASVAEYFDYYNHDRLHSSIVDQTLITLISSFFKLLPQAIQHN